MSNTFQLGRESRNIRVFISSTFQDMHAEREELVKHIFPQLRKLCERYGWMPEEIPQGLIEEQEWLKEHPDTSVTALEIFHGVLNNPEMADHAYFYSRSPTYIDSIQAEEQKNFVEQATEEEIAQLGPEEAKRCAENRRQKLRALKATIKEKNFPVRENYHNPKELGQRILQDLTTVIAELWPEESIPDPLDREQAEHEAFARKGLSEPELMVLLFS